MKKSTLSRSAMANVLQVGLNAMLLLLLYRYLASTLGASKLGIWSMVLASASASHIVGLGLSASVACFVAK